MKLNLHKNEIKNSLYNLYGEKSDWIIEKVEELLEKYSSLSSLNETPLSEKDVILITYGDNIQKGGKTHLQTLNDFIGEYCLPEINTTHLLPFFPFTSDDGFSVSDYFKVNPDFGTWNDINKLSKNSNLMFDAVINHMSKSSNWFKSYLNNEENFKDYFINVNPNADLSKVVRPRALPLLTEFEDTNKSRRHIWTTFSEDQVDLNFSSPEVFVKVLEVLLFYISKQAKFIRFDAVAFLWKTIGTSCIHLPETHTIIQLYKKIITSITKNIYFITETNVPHNENISYFGDGKNEADLVYNFTLAPLLVYSIMKNNVETLTNWATSLKLPSNKVCFFNFTASHDGIGVRPLQNIISDDEINELAKWTIKHNGKVSYKNNEDGSQSPYELNCNYMDILSNKNDNDEFRANKMLLTQAVMLAIPGIPGIYIHSLIGSQNYYKGVEESGINRRINREKLDFDMLKDELNNKNSLRNMVYSNYKTLLRIRTSEKAFNPFGKASYRVIQKSIFVIKREFENQVIYATFNFGNKSIKINALSQNVFDLINKKEIKESTWEIKPYNFVWYKS
ncbi:MAG: sugar phosphorylase [Lutibacter sp.]|uniref:sugar phosphorylase n=1 Tax=Lutibacter sp. TaxID=1925666 RepID=UPI00299DD811|nr:sugar phosphorylase [Lutibacter sp.]MDX1828126.1 sugar phosphorylase [Lutibacter sp.]